MPLRDALELFLLDCQSRRLAAHTLTFYRSKVGDFIRWHTENGYSNLADVTSHTIKRYMVHLQDRGLTDHSQHDYARPAKTFLAYCVRDELLEKSPFDKVKLLKIAETLPVILTDEEIRHALQCIKMQRNRLIIRFILDSGVRASELLALNVADVDISTGVVMVYKGKGQKGRLTAIGATTRKEMKRYLLGRNSPSDIEPLIATLRGGDRLTLIGLMGVFRRMQAETGIEHLTAHTLRRTMATKSLAGGMDAYVLARMLGHADLQMMKRYAAINKETMQKQAERFSVVDNFRV